jgi:hypothetical protein
LLFVQGKQIDLGAPTEVPSDGLAKKRRGRPATIGHFHDDEGSQDFPMIIFKPTFGKLPTPAKNIY